MPYPVNTFPNFSALLAYINNFWITNGIEEITGVIGNDVVNGLLTFVEQSPLNWQTTDIFSTGGAISPVRPVNIIMSVTPDSISWGDNIYNQYIFSNTTSGDIPSQTYYDNNLSAVTIIPAKSVVNIAKAKNGNWILISSTGVIKDSLNLVVGESGAPQNGQSIWQSDDLIGLGGSLERIQITLAEVPMSSYGMNASFTLDNILGIIDISPNTFYNGSSLNINLNQ